MAKMKDGWSWKAYDRLHRSQKAASPSSMPASVPSTGTSLALVPVPPADPSPMIMPESVDLSEFDRKLGARIRIARTAAGLSPDAAGRLLDICGAQLAQIERGHVQLSAYRLLVLANAFRVSPAWLLTGNEEARTAHELLSALRDLPAPVRRHLVSALDDQAGTTD
jgi:transcriptional regulator with XRE-family HTH domain